MHSQFAQDNVVSQNSWRLTLNNMGSKMQTERIFKKKLNYNQMVKHDSQCDLTLCHRHHIVISK